MIKQSDREASREFERKPARSTALGLVLGFAGSLASSAAPASGAAPVETKTGSAWPQAYSVRRDEAAGVLVLETQYYSIEHALRKGGAISKISLRNGRAANLLVRPIETRVRDENGIMLSDLGDIAPAIAQHRAGLNEIMAVEAALTTPDGRPSGLKVKTTYEYRWGYVKIHKEFLWPGGAVRLRELCPLSTVLSPGLTDYGYREGITEEEGAPAFSFGSNRWGRVRPDRPSALPLRTSYVPRSMIFIDPGVEGLEWFIGSDLAQWEKRPAGRRGGGRCSLEPEPGPPAGLALSISPLWRDDGATPVASGCAFDYYFAVPLLEGHAHPPWLHTSFNRNKGDWVSTEQIRRWAGMGYRTVHCHNDGDYYGDGLFWRDGSYPPYPDMDRYDRVLGECRRAGIRTATYFSNKELHSSTAEFREHGEEWGRKDRGGVLRHTIYREGSEFGALMCLRSGWLGFLKSSIDRVLENHPLDGVYYDWNVALDCMNPLHEGKAAGEPADGHWDMDELLDLMEWTRERLGPGGLLIIHNTTVPMFVTENFSDHVVATEWGYGKWTDRAPALDGLPLEWTLAGARSRGVISYGTIDENAPRRLHRLFALEALLGGVTPWPPSPESFELLPLLKPLGDIASFRFADWRNRAVRLSDPACASAVYSRPGEAYLLLANLDSTPRKVRCILDPGKLSCPLPRPTSISIAAGGSAAAGGTNGEAASTLDVGRLIGEGLEVTIPGDGAVVLRIR